MKTYALLSGKKAKVCWIGVLLLIVVGAGLLIFYPSLFSSALSQASTGAKPVARSVIFTSPESAAKQFCSDIMTDKYDDAYLLLSLPAHQALEPVGGATYLAQQMQTYAKQYGVMTGYTVVNQVRRSPTETIVTVTVRRMKLTDSQTEKDTLTVMFTGKTWVIDHWGSDIATNSQHP